MAEQKIEKVAGGAERVSIEVKDGDNTIAHTYTRMGLAAFKAWIATLPQTVPDTDEGKKLPSIEKVWDLYRYALDLKERASVRESAAADSTVIMVGKKATDLLKDLTPARAVGAVNAAFLLAASTGKPVQNAYKVARRKMLAGEAQFKVQEKDNMLHLVK